MPLTSMTGFSRAQAEVDAPAGAFSVQVEARCVNGRSSDIKLRLPSGFEHLDKPVRAAFQAVVQRGNANITLSVQRASSRQPRLNEQTLNSLRSAMIEQAEAWGESPPSLTDMLSLPGVIEMADTAADAATDDDQSARDATIMQCAQRCAHELGAARQAEGLALHGVISQTIDQIEQETSALAAHPDVQAEHQMQRLTAQVEKLLADSSQLDPQRLHQEAALLATKADIEEELARLRAHIEAARDLLAASQPVGRKLDFLAQEFNREANTICSKAGSIAITQHGLALKALIDQVKEQVQNVE